MGNPYKFFMDVIKQDFDVELAGRWDRGVAISTPADSPDYVICSDPGNEHLGFTCPKIFYSCEYRPPNFDVYDWIISYSYCDHPRHYRMPFYLMYPFAGDMSPLMRPKLPFEELWNRKFCCVVFGKDPGSESPREGFFHELCKYKKVDSAGRWMNNIGHVLPYIHNAKTEFCKGYKFVLSFENRSASGYTTEKLPEAMWANSIGVYWGNPDIGREFNVKSFVNCGGNGNPRENLFRVQDFASAIQRIIELDQDKEKYATMIAEPYFPDDNIVPPEAQVSNLLKFFHRVFEES